jgi:hypothetical protein
MSALPMARRATTLRLTIVVILGPPGGLDCAAAVVAHLHDAIDASRARRFTFTVLEWQQGKDIS